MIAMNAAHAKNTIRNHVGIRGGNIPSMTKPTTAASQMNTPGIYRLAFGSFAFA